jgi:hypothetical protein
MLKRMDNLCVARWKMKSLERKAGEWTARHRKVEKERNVDRFKLGTVVCGKKRTGQPGVYLISWAFSVSVC